MRPKTAESMMAPPSLKDGREPEQNVEDEEREDDRVLVRGVEDLRQRVDDDVDVGRAPNPYSTGNLGSRFALTVTALSDLDDLAVRAACLVAQHLERQLLVDRVPLHEDPLRSLGDR